MFNTKKHTARRLIASILLAGLVMNPFPAQTVYSAELKSSSLIVNTEAFQFIDTGNGTDPIALRFGTSTNFIQYTGGTFRFSAGINVPGTVSGTTLNANTLLTGSTLQGFGLYDCQGTANKLTYNATTKKFLCEADQTGGAGSPEVGTASFSGATLRLGDARYVKKAGDTMTGALTIQNGNTHSATSTPLLNIRGTMSGRAIYISGTGSSTVPLLATDLKFGSLLMGTGSLKNGTGSIFPQFFIQGRLPTSSRASVTTVAGSHMHVRGKYAYVAGGTSFGVYDVTNPLYPTSVGTATVPSGSNDMAVEGKYAYVVGEPANKNSLTILDITNPASPKLIKSYDMNTYSAASPFFGRSISVQGRYAYIVGYTDGAVYNLYTFDISDPNNAFRTSTVAISSDTDRIQALGRYLYLPRKTTGVLALYDLKNPATPALETTVTVGTSPRSAVIQDKYAYVSNATDGTVSVVDVSTPSAPVVVGTVTVGTTPKDMVIMGRLLYVLNTGGTTVSVVDVSNPRSPKVFGTFTVPASPLTLDVVGRYAYVTTSTTLSVYDIGGAYIQQLEVGGLDTANASIRGELNIIGTTRINGGATIAQGLDVTGPTAIYGGTGAAALFVGSTTREGIKIEAFGNTSTTRHLLFGYQGTFDASIFRAAANLLKIDSKLFLLGTTGDVLTISGGTLKQTAYGTLPVMSGANVPTNVRTVVVSGEYLFAGNDAVSGNEVRIFNVFNPSYPLLISGIEIGATVNAMVQVGKYLYVASNTIAGSCSRQIVTGCEFRIYDIGNITSPVAMGGVDIGVDVTDIKLLGDKVFMTTDVSSATCNTSTGANIGGCEFRVYDINDPYTPRPVGGVNDTVNARSVALSDGLAYVAYDSDSSTAKELKIFMVNNHRDITLLGGVDANVNSLNFTTVEVTGGYALIGTSVDANTCSGATVTGCEFRIYRVTDPTTPVAVSGLSEATGINALDVKNDTVFASFNSGASKEISVIDITNINAPVIIGGYDHSSDVYGITVVGNTIYVGTTTDWKSLTVPGIHAPTATIGAIKTTDLVVTESARINDTLYVGNGLNVDRGGVNLRGPLAIQSSSTGGIVYTGLEVKNLTGTTMFSVRDDGFADALRGVGGYDGYLGQEFNDEKAYSTADSVIWGDDLTWVVDVSSSNCSYLVNETYPTYHRSQMATVSTGCNLYMGAAAGDIMNFVSATGSLARVMMKVRVNSTSGNQRNYFGLINTLANNNLTEPTEGIYMKVASGTGLWEYTVNPLTGPSTYGVCPGATVQTAVNKFALIEILSETSTRVRFRVDPDTTDGINFIECGTASTSGVKAILGVGALLNTNASFSGTAQQDIDYIRVWTTSGAP